MLKPEGFILDGFSQNKNEDEQKRSEYDKQYENNSMRKTESEKTDTFGGPSVNGVIFMERVLDRSSSTSTSFSIL